MTLTELRYIVAVAREKHFGRAASACYVSQPTLSVAIKKLEEELGVLLFERGPGEVTVTPTGGGIVEQAQRVLEEAARIKEMAQAGRDPLAGQLRVGAIYTIGPYLFPRLVPILRRAAPTMQLIIHENYTHVLATMLKQGEVDAIIVALPFSEHGVETLPLYDEPFMVAVPQGHPFEKRKSISADELEKESLLLLGAGHCFRDQVLDLCAKVHRTANGLQRTLEGGSLETIRQMVASGVGITVLPSSSVSPTSGDLIRVRPFTKPVPARRVALAWRRSFPRPKAIQVLTESILACELPQVNRVH